MKNEEKGDYLLDAISKLEQEMKHGRSAEYPYRKSLQLRLKLVLAGTAAECVTEVVQDRLVPEQGDINFNSLTDKAQAIKASNDESLFDVFKGQILEDQLGI